MTVKQVSDLCLREASRGFIVSLKASNRYSASYLAYLRERPRWFGTRESADPQTVSQSYIDAQYRHLNRFFNWLVQRGHVEDNPLRLIKRPHVDERTVPVVSEREVLDRLTHHVHIPEMNGDSYRLRHSRQSAAYQVSSEPEDS